MGSWDERCHDILGVIVDQLSAIEDIGHFGAVCQAWRSVSVEKWHLSIVDPWLMLAEKKDSDNRGFYSLSTKKVYYLNLPEARGRKCWSSYGWLITLGLDLEIHLLNPFSRSRVSIRLPSLRTLPNQYSIETSPEFIRRAFIKKVILSSRPSKRITSEDHNEKCVVMGIFSEFRRLSFMRLGDEVWTHVYTPREEGCITDVVYLNGQFYGFTSLGKLVIVDISSPDPKTIEIAEPPDGRSNSAEFYLVESVGELFMIAREVYVEYNGVECNERQYVRDTDLFEAYKFNFDDSKWTKVKSLDNRAIFVGVNASFAIFPSSYSECEPNCIYFTDDGLYGLMKETPRKDMGVFWIETEEFDDHYIGPEILSRICGPLWICPSP
ncbi:putative F-box protein At5g55150 [Macadamia integrifolia]|uniref:putative F-box protein At5g55150 n=1 Tax=Macadamia integrifolia TaxID=60698 RepID=UPI001C4F3C0B|nr:putative F-box protein At5g55150 [Macadamia integrifolia]XP_042485697.1 putative F-box protein At5g55150 [Macadamia integrifolia]XP_042485698.1 putative F-box protein At5g55150 [Macadamia integrifolia]XP_042485699.1 putative F-box protein At5g55150 [Macadamia integrifolia]XP_042485700.1 putative F-box protein At5g55150 [Macadamia integrifolia]XP_042485701.1 putative F-box protein At5g55150 [Macadamia integrifolia]XP_042485702.1 putative F-box protein At5g55150 [Macadamia integrifolia]XP_0